MLHDEGPVTPESDNAPRRGSGWGVEDQGNSKSADATALADRDRQGKAIATARAQAALAGFELHAVLGSDGSAEAFLLTRWNLSRELPDLAAVSAFLDRVTSHRSPTEEAG